ncbi:hypothetical protein KI387_009784, partial [Taxus chinensis]
MWFAAILVLLQLTSLTVEGSIHNYDRAKLSSNGNAFLLYGGSEGLRAPAVQATGSGVVTQTSFIRYFYFCRSASLFHLLRSALSESFPDGRRTGIVSIAHQRSDFLGETLSHMVEHTSSGVLFSVVFSKTTLYLSRDELKDRALMVESRRIERQNIDDLYAGISTSRHVPFRINLLALQPGCNNWSVDRTTVCITTSSNFSLAIHDYSILCTMVFAEFEFSELILHTLQLIQLQTHVKLNGCLKDEPKSLPLWLVILIMIEVEDVKWKQSLEYDEICILN